MNNRALLIMPLVLIAIPALIIILLFTIKENTNKLDEQYFKKINQEMLETKEIQENNKINIEQISKKI